MCGRCGGPGPHSPPVLTVGAAAHRDARVRARRVAGASTSPRSSVDRASSSSSRPSPTAAWTSPSGRWAARASSSRRCRPPCSTAAPTSPCTRPRTSRRARSTAWCSAAVPERGDPRDALVGCRLGDLPVGAAGGHRARCGGGRSSPTSGPTSPSPGCGGTCATRLEKADGFDAIVVAAVALERLGLGRPDRRGARAVGAPAPGGARARWRSSAAPATTPPAPLLAAIEHAPSRRAVDAERAFLAELGGDCDLPAGAHAVVDVAGHLVVDALLASPDGHVVLRHRATGDDPESVGRRAARTSSTAAASRCSIPERPGAAASVGPPLPSLRHDRVPRRRRARGPGAAHRARRRAARAGRRRRVRPPVGRRRCSTSPPRPPSGSPWARPPAAGAEPGRDQRPARRAGRPTRRPRSCGSRAATRSSSPGAARRRPPWPRPASPSRSCPASPRPSPRRPTPASPSRSATRRRRSPSSPATRTRRRARAASTGRPSPGSAARSSCSWASAGSDASPNGCSPAASRPTPRPRR